MTTTLKVEEAENDAMTFLIDTGSSFSLVKPKALHDDVQCIRLENPLFLEGIGSGVERADYYVSLNVEKGLKHTFFVVPDEFGIDEDAILGNDFFIKFNAKIDYKKMSLETPGKRFPLNEKVDLLTVSSSSLT